MKNIITYCLLYFISIGLFCQQNNAIVVSGKVLDAETLLPLEYVTVTISDSTKIIKGTISDRKGKFELSVQKGTYRIEISYMGFKSYKTEYKTYSDNTKLNTISLFSNAEELKEVTITSEKRLVELKIDKKIYNIQADKNNRGKTLTEVLNTIPSLDVNPNGTVSLRGNSGTRVLINGNFVNTTSNISDLLLQLPSESIEKVEVITNPSARYDAEGNSGILNIITKKEKSNNLGIATTLSAGVPDNQGISVNLSYRKNSLSLYSTAFYRYLNQIGAGNIFQEYLNTLSELQNTFENRVDDRRRKMLYFNAGMYNRINKTSSLSVNVNAGNFNNKTFSEIDYLDVFLSKNTQENSERLSDELEDELSYEFNASYSKEFKNNAEFSISIEYEGSDENKQERITIDNSENNDNTFQDVNSKNNQDVTVLQFDYEIPFKKENQFSFGYKFLSDRLKNDYKVFETTGSTTESLDDFSDKFENRLNIHGYYTQYTQKIGAISFLAGLRLESTRQRIHFNALNNEVVKNFDNLFPSAHVNYTLSNSSYLKFAFSRRIQRPYSWTLNPFLSLTNNRNFFSGNPDLNPIYSNNFELNYIYNKSKIQFDISFYHLYSSDIINYIVTQTDKTTTTGNVIFRRFPINNGNESQTGIDINNSVKVNDNLNIFSNIIAYNSNISGTKESLFNANQWIWQAKLGVSYKFLDNINSQLTIRYRSPRENGAFKSEGLFVGDFSMNTEMFKNNATLSLIITDVFNSLISNSQIQQENFLSINSYKYRKRQLNLSFTYRFNRNKVRSRSNEQILKDDFEY